jgi:hypothetical protein
VDRARASAKATLAATSGLLTADGGAKGALDEAKFRAMASFLYAQGIISTQVNGAEAMTNAYVA